nr:uncharacterized protein LOC111509911 [Leptinotarsa decemlineata]
MNAGAITFTICTRSIVTGAGQHEQKSQGERSKDQFVDGEPESVAKCFDRICVSGRKMVSTGKVIVRIVFAICLILVVVTDYTGVLHKLVSGNKIEEANHVSPRPTNPGYGDSKTDIDIDADIEEESVKNLGYHATRAKILKTIKKACLPKLICELTASTQREKLTESERSLLSLLKDTTISTTAEVTSKYHFAAHMGQLINGIDGNGCFNFYPTCPFPGLQVLQMIKKVRMR